MMERRTDLALEVRESFKGDGGEIEGVSLDKENVWLDEGHKDSIEVSTVVIMNEKGRQAMGKPVGSYITMETGDVIKMSDAQFDNVMKELGSRIESLTGNLKHKKVLVAGLGNRYITADSLGPYVVDGLDITRHYAKEFGDSFLKKFGMGEMCAIAPGVMAQTGMESEEIISAVVGKTKPDIIIVVDALAARSVGRVTTTIQITDTGINPGSGVGNHRIGLNEESIGTKVIGIGVPTVVEAEVIVRDRIEEFMYSCGLNDDEIYEFLEDMSKSAIRDMYVTTKNIDESVERMGELIAGSINAITHSA